MRLKIQNDPEDQVVELYLIQISPETIELRAVKGGSVNCKILQISTINGIGRFESVSEKLGFPLDYSGRIAMNEETPTYNRKKVNMYY